MFRYSIFIRASFSLPYLFQVFWFFIQSLKMYFLQNFNRSKTRFHQYLLCCFISFFLVFFHFLQTMHKKSALILIADTTPYKKIIKIISTFFVIFFSYYQDFFCASFVIFSLIILNLLIFCLCFKYSVCILSFLNRR